MTIIVNYKVQKDSYTSKNENGIFFEKKQKNEQNFNSSNYIYLGFSFWSVGSRNLECRD